MTKPIIIIGTGLAGYMLAKEFRKCDQHTPLEIITASDGRFYSKPLLSTALTQNKTADCLAVFSATEMAEQLHATVHTHTVVKKIDPKNKIVFTDKEIPYERLVLALGAQTITPPLEGNAVKEMVSVNDLQDYAKFREWLQGKKHIAILGAGLVGCEFANDLINVDIKVDIVAPERAPLTRFVPDAIGAALKIAMADKGVSWHLGHLATCVDRSEQGVKITLDDGSFVEAEGVLSAIGLRPSIELAKQAGLAVHQGIQVDRCLQTSDPHIYALGDCAEVDGVVKQYVAPILQCARALAKILAGGREPVHYPTMPIVIKTPACPVVSCPPPDVAGEWNLEGEGSHLSALYHDVDGQLRGFALVGDKVRDKMPLAKKLPLVFT